VNIKDLPYYSGVPKGLKENLEYREKIIKRAATDEVFATAVRKMCEEDILFYINVMCWTFNPKDKAECPKIPFITYEYQDEAIMGLLTGIYEGHDIAWPKSRTMGASWMAITVFEWLWHFKHDMSLLVVSRVQNLVDMKGNTDSLLWKIDFLHENQPKWLLPRGVDRKLLQIKNLETKSIISGESTTSNLGRGGRRTAILIDEFAAFELNASFEALHAVRDTTNCRLFNSTPQGSANAFYKVVHDTSAEVFEMHWTRHPMYAKGKYTSEKIDGRWKVRILDKELNEVVDVRRIEKEFRGKYKFPEDYPFILDGKMRSPWYDNQCARCATQQEIGQELDIDFLGSAFQAFDAMFIREYKNMFCLPPRHEGEISFNRDTMTVEGFTENDSGRMKLWFTHKKDDPLCKNYIKKKKFGVACDVSAGTGASNSVITVVNLEDGKKVALWKDHQTTPTKFAEIAVAVAKMFNNARLTWDALGPGQSFSKKVRELHYGNLYYHKDEIDHKKRMSSAPGHFLNPDVRTSVLRSYRDKLADGDFINVSASGVDECLQFIVETGGKWVHSASLSKQDPNGAGAAHGDEVIADALAADLLTKSSRSVQMAQAQTPMFSFEWFYREEQNKVKVRSDW